MALAKENARRIALLAPSPTPQGKRPVYVPQAEASIDYTLLLPAAGSYDDMSFPMTLDNGTPIIVERLPMPNDVPPSYISFDVYSDIVSDEFIEIDEAYHFAKAFIDLDQTSAYVDFDFRFLPLESRYALKSDWRAHGNEFNQIGVRHHSWSCAKESLYLLLERDGADRELIDLDVDAGGDWRCPRL